VTVIAAFAGAPLMVAIYVLVGAALIPAIYSYVIYQWLQ